MCAMLNSGLTLRLSSLVLGSCLMVTSCQRDEPAASGPSPAPRVKVVTAQPRDIGTVRSWPATVEPLRVLQVIAPHDGWITAIHAEPGGVMSAGAPFLEMRIPDAEARRGELESQVGQLGNEVRRMEELAAVNAVSDASVAEARIRLHAASAELQAIEAAIADGALATPVSGEVLQLLVSEGSRVFAEMPLASIADASSFGLRLDLPNAELRYMESPEALRVEDEKGDSHRVARVVRHGEISPNTTRLELWLDPSSSPAAGAVRVGYHSSREVLCIPWSAVAADDGRSWVALVDGEGHIRRRDITTGQTTGTFVEVVSGLEGGDDVVRYQPRSHADGARITPVIDETAAAEAE